MEAFLDFIARIWEVDPGTISMDTAYKSVKQWDSLMHLRLVAEIEETYQAEIPIDEVPDIRTLADFYRYLGE